MNEPTSGKRVLQVFGPYFGLPDPSPFCMKAMVLLKLSGLDYQTEAGDVRKAPKRKFPVLIDNGKTIADTTFIRFHLENTYGIDFDAGLSDEQRGIAWMAEKLCEDHIYWIAMSERWMDENNFKRGPAKFFEDIPQPMRAGITWMVRRDIRRALHGHGIGTT